MKLQQLFLTILFLSSCKPTADVIMINEKPNLVGKAHAEQLKKEPFNTWFDSGYDTYKPEFVNELKQTIGTTKISVFMGTWCEDSQNQVPKFYKIMNELGVKTSSIELITMDKSKKTPQNLEAGLNITNVPTFIFYQEGKEVNRIVESPIETLERDMLKIFQNVAYKPNYSK